MTLLNKAASRGGAKRSEQEGGISKNGRNVKNFLPPSAAKTHAHITFQSKINILFLWFIEIIEKQKQKSEDKKTKRNVSLKFHNNKITMLIFLHLPIFCQSFGKASEDYPARQTSRFFC